MTRSLNEPFTKTWVDALGSSFSQNNDAQCMRQNYERLTEKMASPEVMVDELNDKRRKEVKADSLSIKSTIPSTGAITNGRFSAKDSSFDILCDANRGVIISAKCIFIGTNLLVNTNRGITGSIPRMVGQINLMSVLNSFNCQKLFSFKQ